MMRDDQQGEVVDAAKERKRVLSMKPAAIRKRAQRARKDNHGIRYLVTIPVYQDAIDERVRRREFTHDEGEDREFIKNFIEEQFNVIPPSERRVDQSRVTRVRAKPR